MSKLLTIGMAHYDDFDGVYFTIQALRLYHPDAMEQVEIIVIDNNPASMVSKELEQVVHHKIGPGHKYIPFPNPVGTSPSRDQIFKEAAGEYVLVIDCHVLLHPQSLNRLLDWYNGNYETNDLYQGPLVYDGLTTSSTHFDDNWRADMWGTWGSAWLCPCSDPRELADPACRFSICQDPNDDKIGIPREVKMGFHPINTCSICGREIPTIPFYGHQNALASQGFIELGKYWAEAPFEIPGQGLGLFSCRKDAWLGFNKDSRQFGGEELYIHEKFRKAGNKAVCLPFLRWTHRFNRPKGPKYPLSLWGKARNYVLEFNELGMPLNPVKDHFVRPKKISEVNWNWLVENPIEREKEPTAKECQTCGKESQIIYPSIDTAFKSMKSQPRDLNQHMDKLKEFAEKCDVVTEIGKRRESTMAFLDAHPKVLRSYSTERVNKHLVEEAEANGTKVTYGSPQDVFSGIEETDLLFLDYIHTFERTKDYLAKLAPSVKRFIVFHDTQLHKHRGEDNKEPGLFRPIIDFTKHHPEWSVIYWTEEQYGLMALGCLTEDKPKVQPGLIEQGKNWIKALAAFKSSGGQQTTEAEFQERMDICGPCPYRKDDRCTVCGCFLTKGVPVGKAMIRVSECPLNYWPKLEVLQ